jgi:hypothetical protein
MELQDQETTVSISDFDRFVSIEEISVEDLEDQENLEMNPDDFKI